MTSEPKSLLHALRDQAAPRDEDLDALRAQVLRHIGEAPTTDWLQGLRIARPAGGLRGRPGAPAALGLGWVGRLAAAGLVALLGAGGLAWWMLEGREPERSEVQPVAPQVAEIGQTDEPSAPAATPAQPAPEAPQEAVVAGPSSTTVPLVAEVPEALRLLDGDVQLSHTGRGTLERTDRRVSVAWSAGTIEVQVAPGREVVMEVQTDEASVLVVGTIFSVHRDYLGTTVSVQRGEVAVRCGEGSTQSLTSGKTLCLPVRPEGWLNRAMALEGQGASPFAVLAATDAGLAGSPEPPIRAQLEVRQIRLLEAIEDFDTTLEVGERLLQAERARTLAPEQREIVLNRVVRAAIRLGGCARAEVWLPQLEASDVPGACR